VITSAIAAKVGDYIEGVLSGEIVTSQRVRDAVARHVADLEKEDSMFYFDRKQAESVCKFFPLLIKHSIGEFAGAPFELEPWQAFGVWVLFGWKRKVDGSRRFRKAYWSMGRKNGKALSLDTLLPTPSGFTTMGEVQAGDYLIGMDGKPVLVEAVTEVMHERPCYKMTFSTGESVVCDEEHQWLTDAKVQLVGCKGAGRKLGSAKESVKTTKDISESVRYGARKDTNHSVRLATSAEFEAKHLPIEPYTLGAWLGDGNSSGPCITVGYNDLQIIDTIKQDGYFVKERKSSNENSGLFALRLNSTKSKKNNLRVMLREIGVLDNKHIPIQYLRSSYEQRLQLLRGLMDTDGYISPKGQCEFVSISKTLAEDVCELVCSLGIKATILEHDAKLYGRVISKKYRVYFFAFQPFIPFGLARKAIRVPTRVSEKKPRGSTRRIVSCEPIVSVPVKCVQVTGGMYSHTRSFIPTHNSSFAAGLCHFLAVGDIDPKTGKPEAVAQILLTATKKDQAKVIYSEAERMRNQSPTLKSMSGVKYETITYTHNQSYMRMVSSDKPFDGLNPHCVVMDELHAWGEHHRRFYDTMVTGSASRSQPLHLIITTAGDDHSHLWMEDYHYACQVVRGVIEDESLFALIYEIDEGDDPGDESNWIKANPNLGVSVKIDYLQQRWNEDKHSSIGVNRFTRYHCNRVVSSTEKAFDLKDWDACEGQLSNWSECDAIGAGVDLGARDDFGGIGYCTRFLMDTEYGKPVYRYEIRSKAFIASDSKRDLTKMPFAGWVHSGQLQAHQYPIEEMTDQLLIDASEYGIDTCAYDPYNGQQISERMAKEGITAARMAQNQANFNEAIRDFQDLIQQRRITHDGNPILRWCVDNAIIAKDRQDRWMFDKKSSNEKIDPLVAMVMAFRVASLAPEKSTGKMFII
jgi:phage terminase large subunit-like protein